MIAGVADGLALAWGWRTWLVRLGFVATSLLAGLGIVLYALAWVLVPEEGQPESIGQRIVRRLNIQPTWVGYGLLLIAGLVIGSAANIDFGVLLAGALLVTGFLLYRGDLGAAAPSEETAPGQPSRVYQRTPRPPRPRSYLGRLTIGALLLTLGVVGALDAVGAAHPTSRHYAAAAVLVVGIGLLIGSVAGRARGLIFLGLLLLPVLVIAAIADIRFGTTWETITVRPQSLDELVAAYSTATGDITIDLTEVDFAGRSVELDLDTGIGNISLYAPVDVAIDARAQAMLGRINMEGELTTGLGADMARLLDGEAGTIIVTADLRMGSIEIFRWGENVAGFIDESFPDEAVIDPSYVEVVGELALLEPTMAAEIADIYAVYGGELVLDLTRVTGSRRVVDISLVGDGFATIIVPPTARLVASSPTPFKAFGAASPQVDGRFFIDRPGEGRSYAIAINGPNVTIKER